MSGDESVCVRTATESSSSTRCALVSTSCSNSSPSRPLALVEEGKMTFMRNYHTTCEVSESAIPARVTKPYTGYQMSYQTLQSETGRYTVKVSYQSSDHSKGRAGSGTGGCGQPAGSHSCV